MKTIHANELTDAAVKRPRGRISGLLAALSLLAIFNVGLLPAAAAVPAPRETLPRIERRGHFLWGADGEGGAPYLFPDPAHPERMIGFEVDLAEALARELGTGQRHVQNAWDSLIPALNRGDFDLAMNGLEITPERQGEVLFSIPYYFYSEQLVVRKDDARINSMEDLGKLPGVKVGTLAGAAAIQLLSAIRTVEIKVYTGQVEPYEDLALGRLDAVLLDLPIAAYYGKPNPRLRYAGPPAGEGAYGIALRKGDVELKTRVDAALMRLIENGTLRRIYEKWDLWTPAQERLSPRAPGVSTADAPARAVPPEGKAAFEQGTKTSFVSYFPLLLKGAGVTLVVSVLSMLLAIALGLVLTLGRLYGPPVLQLVAGTYIEVYRGTPLLIQLYLLYYGLPNIGLSLAPFVAAVLGLGMNYAAYEAELYRAGIAAIPRGQMEAALSLGMARNLAVRRIVLPQAFKIALPGITNDFIALFKDSSLVSVIAMVELTKTYSMVASSTLRFLEFGLIVALLYFAMSYPLSLLARRLEHVLRGARRVKGAQRR